MRFVLDEDVDARAVGTLLRNHRHECWTIVDAGLSGADDDAVAAYTDSRGAVLITHDAAATRRRRRFTFGQHVYMRCHQLEAADLLERHLIELVEALDGHQMGVFVVSTGGVAYHPPRYEPD